MIRTFIVEDEAFLRQSIKRTIESVNPDFQIIGMAGDGEQAIIEIEKACPEVVFLDVRMPIMDGLACLKLIRRQFPSIICVMLSGYSDFEYVQQALQNQACDYILKPIDKSKLSELLNKISKKIFKEKKELQNRYLQSLLNHISSQTPYSNKTVENYFHETPFFTCIYFHEGSYPVNPYLYLTTDNYFWTTDLILSAVSALLLPEEQVWLLQGTYSKEHFIIIGHPINQPQRCTELVHSLFQHFLASPHSITCIASMIPLSLDKLQDTLIELKHLSYSKSLFSFSSLNDCTKDSSKNWKEMGLTAKTISNLTKFASEQQIRPFWDHTLAVLNRCETPKCPQYLLMSILKKICEIAKQETLDIFYEEQIDLFISSSDTYEKLKNNIEALLYEILQPTNPDGTEAIISSIHQYIKDHFTENLTLKSLAEPYYISIPYMCTLYKKIYHVSPIDDIISRRIDLSKKLLSLEPPLNIKQISEMVGYSDSYYFSRLFKASTGFTPSNYRKSNTQR